MKMLLYGNRRKIVYHSFNFFMDLQKLFCIYDKLFSLTPNKTLKNKKKHELFVNRVVFLYVYK